MNDQSPFAGKHILFIVENLPVPFDRRVWQEATTLREAGAEVTVLCPAMKGYTASYECLEGIAIYRHPLPFEASGALGYLIEYGSAIFWWYWYSLKIFARKRFHVIHGCNPPDLIFIVAAFFKLFGVKYVFDHHDVNPELYIAKFGRKNFFYRLMRLFERITFKVADFSIATNESYREIAVRRGGMPADRVTVVRSGPKIDRLRIGPGDERVKKGRTYLVGYLGVIGEQEGIDLLLHVICQITQTRQDVQFAIVGGGTSLDEMKQLAGELRVTEYVDFYGRVSDEEMLRVLNTADVCVNPDKPTEMNDLSTMNKIMEYMALKKPIVQFDLKEGWFSARESSLYARRGDITDFADNVLWLLDNPIARRQMGEIGYNRIINELSWDHEKLKLLSFYREVVVPTGIDSRPAPTAAPAAVLSELK